LDEEEGADILMVKPALSYLDVIHILKENVNLPISAYNVSGEYAMLYAAAQNGWLDKNRAMKEMLLSIQRAGADIILTYFAKEYASLLREELR
jgi:porphobilinogen synthase